MRERRQVLGGSLPIRQTKYPPLEIPPLEAFRTFFKGSGTEGVSSTAAYVGILSVLLADRNIGKSIVPIIPDEARTFGMDPFFARIGIYSNVGQRYEPVDANTLKAYRERKNGQMLEEGITEAGAMCSFIAAGTAYATHGMPAIPFFTYYSMFGFQRIGDLIWAAADMRARGFLLGGTAGRTTLNGEGLQHEDGHSLLLASAVPTLSMYDPAYAYELAVIIQDGIRRMYHAHEDVMYYITLYNEKYPMPPMPANAVEGILKGFYKLRPSTAPPKGTRIHLFGSGPILRKALTGSGSAGREVRPGRGCVECHQLPRTAARCSGSRTLEHAAPRRIAPGAVRAAGAADGGGNLPGGERLCAAGAGDDPALGSGRANGAGHGWFWTERKPFGFAAFLRDRCGEHGPGGSIPAHASRRDEPGGCA